MKRKADIGPYCYSLVRDGPAVPLEEPVRAPIEAATLIHNYLQGRVQEHIVVVLLNTRKRPIGIVEVATGGLNTSFVTPAQVFRPAILAGAHTVILGHNHPSEDPTPSPEDLNITSRMVEAGKILGIRVLDHIITTGEGSFVSLRSIGVLEELAPVEPHEVGKVGRP